MTINCWLSISYGLPSARKLHGWMRKEESAEEIWRGAKAAGMSTSLVAACFACWSVEVTISELEVDFLACTCLRCSTYRCVKGCRAVPSKTLDRHCLLSRPIRRCTGTDFKFSIALAPPVRARNSMSWNTRIGSVSTPPLQLIAARTDYDRSPYLRCSRLQSNDVSCVCL